MYKKLLVLGIALSVATFACASNTQTNTNQTQTKAKSAQTVCQKVNINTANVKKLTTVKGITKTQAKNIVAYRNKYGKFKAVNDLTKVKGIDKKTVTKVSKYLTV
jgi:comEA protein